MIIPWGTDAPIYHRPLATAALMVANVLTYLLVPHQAYEDYSLVLGDGVHPLQWLTNPFLHGGLFHLLGNLVFLWTFGLVVEGKLGWWAFLLVYLGLGSIESAAVQVLVPSGHSVHMLGSSGIIFGLLAMCLVWAPRNEVLCILWLRFTPMEIELSILWFALLYLGLDVLTAGMSGVILANLTNDSSVVIMVQVLYPFLGAILGFALGIALLQLRLVDCEDWDLFAVLQRRTGRSKKADDRMRRARPRAWGDRAPKTEPRHRRGGQGQGPGRRQGQGQGRDRSAPVRSIEDASAAALRSMRQHLELGEVEAALAVYQKASRTQAGWQPPERDWRDLIEGLLGQDLFDDAVRVMRDYISKQPEPSVRVRLRLAQVLVQKLNRPLQAEKVLGQIPAGSLPESLEAIRRQLARKAEFMQEEGPLELEDELW